MSSTLPKRTADNITKGRDENKNSRGQRELKLEKHKRLADFQKVVGIRDAELKALRGRNLFLDGMGNLYVVVENGKGGKYQQQRVFPEHEKIVLDIFQGVENNEFVFSKSEVRINGGTHALRRKNAQNACKRYEGMIETDPRAREKLGDMILQHYDRVASRENMDKFRKGKKELRERIERAMRSPLYKLRGANRQKAIANGRPVVYDSMALLATAEFHLAHHRFDVVSVNYMS